MTHKDLPVFSFATADEFYAWLSKHHDTEKGFWLRYFKKASGKATIMHTDAVDVALCWGWIDGLINAYDAESYVVRFTPRRPKSIWSKVNVEKVERLITEKRMQPQGLVHVQAAKNDGRWDAAYAPPSTMQIPEEFIALVKTDHKAWEAYQTKNKAKLFAIGFQLATAKTIETKERRMQRLFEQLRTQ